MNYYADTSFLVKLYVAEPQSPMAVRWVRAANQPIAFNALHRLELHNSIHTRLFRGELSEPNVQSVQNALRQDISNGVLDFISLEWNQVFDEAIKLTGRFTRQTGSRSLDILHVAAALTSQAGVFATFDERQAKLAKLAGLQLAAL